MLTLFRRDIPLVLFTKENMLDPQRAFVPLVVEETNILLDKGDTQSLGRLENGTVVLAAAGGGNVLDTGAGGAEDVVDEGELDERGL